MTDYAWDGTPLTLGTSRQHFALTGQRAQWSILGQREMVVVKRYFTDDPRNKSKRFVEYTCRDIYTGEMLPGCRLAAPMGGTQNGDDNVLRPATNVLSGTGTTTGGKTENTPAKVVDGDQVIVGFVEGSRNRPVILGVVPHSGSKRGATSSNGERRLIQHANSSLEFKSDGTVVVTVPAPALGGSSTITLSPSGDVSVAAAGNVNVTAGLNVNVNPGAVGLVNMAQSIAVNPSSPNYEGVVVGSGVDTLTGETYAQLQYASQHVVAKLK